MNKRQRKKLDGKLIVAIRELNNDIAIDEGFPLISEMEIQEALMRVKWSKASVNQTLNAYREFTMALKC